MTLALTDWFRRWREGRVYARARKARADQTAALARAAFSRDYPDRHAPDGWHRIDQVEDGVIVTLLEGVGRPPRRSWWHVGEVGEVTELPYDDVAMRIHLPIWR